MAKKEAKAAFTAKPRRKRPGHHTKPKGSKTGLTGKHPN